MFGMPSSIVWDTYPAAESRNANKKKKKKLVAKESRVQNFEDFFSAKIDEVVQPGKVPQEPESDELLPTIFYVDGSFRVRQPENGEYFEPEELRKLIEAKRIKVNKWGTEAYLITDLDGDSKLVNVKGSIMINAFNNTGAIVGGNCILVPAHMMP